MAFDPKKHVIRVQGNREYLPVSARVVWFRQDHPDWSIITSPVEINLEKQYAIFSASILNAEGKIVATGTKMENIKGFGDYLEKAETGSVGRALAMCGYGAQFAPELEEGAGRYADSPVGPSANRFAARPNNGGGNNYANRPAPRPNGGGNNYGNGEGGPRPPAPLTSSIAEEENPFDLAATARPVAQSAPPARTAEMPSPPSRPAPVAQESRPPMNTAAPRPATPPANAAGGGIQRVREPEREFVDPGGDDEPENPDDDPFLNDDFAAAPPPPANRPAPQRPQQPAVEAAPAPAKANPLAGNPKCTVPGCTAVLTPAQMTLSMQKFGRPICVLHQRDPAITGGDNRSQNAAAL